MDAKATASVDGWLHDPGNPQGVSISSTWAAPTARRTPAAPPPAGPATCQSTPLTHTATRPSCEPPKEGAGKSRRRPRSVAVSCSQWPSSGACVRACGLRAAISGRPHRCLGCTGPAVDAAYRATHVYRYLGTCVIVGMLSLHTNLDNQIQLALVSIMCRVVMCAMWLRSCTSVFHVPACFVGGLQNQATLVCV